VRIGGVELIENQSLHKDRSIRDALELLNGRYGMIITVVDDTNSLCGITTEGDLRKALLSGHGLETPLDVVKNEHPVSIRDSELEKGVEISELVNQLRQRGIGEASTLSKAIAFPVIDDNDFMLGLVTLEMVRLADRWDNSNSDVLGDPQILVVGGAGYIGSVLVNILLEQGFRVRVLDSLLYAQDSLSKLGDNQRLSVMCKDVTDINVMVEAVKGIDAVVFLAEIVGDPACSFMPSAALKTNYLAVNSMAALCSHLNINRFIYTSSCSVYGANKNRNKLLKESSELRPVSHYGRMKILSEQAMLVQYNPLFSPTILRLATVFGNSYRPRFDLVVNTFAKEAYFNKSIEVWGGNQWRPNVHVRDVAQAIITVLKAPLEKVRKQIFNVGRNSENYTINELATLAKQVFPDCKIERNDDSVDNRNYKIGFGKIEEHLGYRAQLTVIDGLNELKEVFDSGAISAPDDERYSNISALRGHFNGKQD